MWTLRRTRRGALVTGLVALACGIPLWAQAQPSPRTADTTVDQTAAPPSVTARVAALFPQTKHWFAIVDGLRFDRGTEGALFPDLRTLSHSRVRHQDGAGHSVALAFPARFPMPLRIAHSSDTRARHISLTPVGAADVTASVESGLVVYANAFAHTDVLYKSTPTHVDEYLLLRSPSAPSRWTYQAALGPGIARLRQAGTMIEAVDAQGRPWLRANRPFAVDALGKRVEGAITVEGSLITVALDLRGLTFPVLVDPDWKSTGDMAYGRFYHRFNLLPNGRMLATGGCSAAVCSGDLTIGSCRSVVSVAETLNLDTKTFSIAGSTAEPRYYHVGESLPNGDVLVAGGCIDPACAVTASAEVYAAATGQWAAIDALPAAGAGHLSASLADGRVLVAGGCTTSGCSARSFLFDPATRGWTEVGALQQARGRAAVIRLNDGKVLAAGGCTTIQCDGVLAAAEVFDPTTQGWTAVGSMASPRAAHYIASVGERVLVGGGCPDKTCTSVLSSSELFDPAEGTFAAGPAGMQPRFSAVALSLPDGRVLVNQGCSTRALCDLTNEAYDPATNRFVGFEAALTGRGYHAIVLHPSQTVITNGGCQPGTCSWWNEYYELSAPDAGGPAVDSGTTMDSGTHADASTHTDAGHTHGGNGGNGGNSGVGGSSGSGGSTPVHGGGGCGCSVPGPNSRTQDLAWVIFGIASVAAWNARRARQRKERRES